MIRRSLALAGLMAAGACAPATAAPTTVDLRVEGLTETIFEGPVTTDAKQIDGHPCDGTNGGVNPTPGPTMTSALDDGAIANGFTWQGTWYDGFDDFGIDRIGPDSTDFTNGRYWGYALNNVTTQVGGCQQQVAAGDEVVFGYDYFSKTHLLELDAPPRAATGEAFPVSVVAHDGAGNSAPAQGASVGGAVSGADGRATVSFDQAGTKRLKAERDGSLRSNAEEVCVYVPGSGDCGTQASGGEAPQGHTGSTPPPPASAPRDETAPIATISGLRDGARYRRGPRTLRGTVEENAGIHQVYLRVRMISRGGCRWLSGRSERFTRPRSCGRARYIRLGDAAEWSYLLPARLSPRARYIVDVKVLDRSLNRGVEQVRFRVG